MHWGTRDLNKNNSSIPITNNPHASTFAIGTWIYVNSFDSTVASDHPLLMIPGNTQTPPSSSPSPPLFMMLMSQTTSLNLYLNTDGSTKGTAVQIMDKVPLQTWIYVVCSVSTHYVDLYWNGELLKSVKLNGKIVSPTNDTTTINPGSLGVSYNPSDIQLVNVMRWATDIDPSDVVTQYSTGHRTSWIPSMNLSLTQQSVPMASFRIT